MTSGSAPVTCYIGIGSNLGDRRQHIERAIGLLKADSRVAVTRVSSIYETDPVSDIPQGKYLNGVIRLETSVPPGELLAILRGIEDALGRTRPARHAPRTIDLDILYYGAVAIATADLTIPHPRIAEREFVRRGLRELGRDV